MRKFQQAKILELVQTLGEANDELKKQTSWEVLQNLLADMQDFALQIGQYIESVAGEGTTTVALLEAFCSTVFEAYQNQNVSNYTKQLKSQMIQVENSVKSELKPDKIEVVFFPYQLSMWDSLESVYLAAKADPNCDAYVVPIPWFDKLPNGDLGRMYYDGDQYPDHIPITNWREYDVQTRRPEAIYIHNGYDEGNYVTSVHPDFYSRRLQNYTDLLVYIPYFVVAQDVQEHFCTAAGCIYAHKVILQSEKIRNIYISVFRSVFGNRFGRPEEKFLSLGSPKFDAVMNAKPENFTLMKQWHDCIYNTDGTKKQVVFYNTTVTGLLQYNEQYLDKLRHVLDVFKKKDDVVLWWRPHPLSESTLKAMRPQLLEKYRSIVDTVINTDEKQGQGKIIFDQSSDLHRAIAISDAYYGSESSVIDLYKVTDKPIMIQNVDVDEYDTRLHEEMLHSDVISFGTRLLTPDELLEKYPLYYKEWFPYKVKAFDKYFLIPDYEFGNSAFFDVLYKTEEDTGKAELFYVFNNEDNVSPLYNPPMRIKDVLLFSPIMARKWAFYNIANDTWSYKEIPNQYCPTDKYGVAFGGGMICGEYILFMPGHHGVFAKYHVETKEITYYRKWFKHLKPFVKNIQMSLISAIAYYEDSLLLFSTHTNVVFEMDPLEMNIKRTYKVGNFQSGFKHAVKSPHANTFYLLKYREPKMKIWTETIVKWNLDTNEIAELTNLPIHLKENHTLNACNLFCFWKGKFYIPPLQGDALLRLDPNTDEIKKIELTPPFDFFKRKSKHYTWANDMALPYVIWNLKRLCYTAQLPYDYSLVNIDAETGVASQKRKWYVSGIENLKVEKASNQNAQGIYSENIYFTVDDFLSQSKNNTETVKSKQISNTENENLGTAGQKIHDYIRSVLLNGG